MVENPEPPNRTAILPDRTEILPDRTEITSHVFMVVVAPIQAFVTNAANFVGWD